MTQPTWTTAAGSIGTFTELTPVNYTFVATPGTVGNTLEYTLLNGVFPASTSTATTFSLSTAGVLTGTSAQVSENTNYSFTIRLNEYDGATLESFSDRTFSFTITGSTAPTFTTAAGSIGSTADRLWFSYQIGISNPDPNTTAIVRLISGNLPDGLEMNTDGLIQGYPSAVASTTVSSFVLEVVSESGYNQRTFSITVTANAAPIPAIFNTRPPTFSRDVSNPDTPYYISSSGYIGVASQDNYFIYKILGYDWTSTTLSYTLTAGSLPDGISLDSNTGYIYGTVASNIATATTAATNQITCTDTSNLSLNQEIVFNFTSSTTTTAPTFGNIENGKMYYVESIVDSTHFTISATYGGPVFSLIDASGTMTSTAFDLLIENFNFTITVTNAAALSNTANFSLITVESIDNVPINPEVTWLTDSNLGTVNNGSTSTLAVSAIAASNVELTYALTSGSLPPDLQLLSNGEIVGNIAFEPESTITPLGDTNTYIFEITASNPDYPSLITSSRTFTLNVYQKFDSPYENVYIKALLDVENRDMLDSLLNDTSFTLDTTNMNGGSGYTNGTYLNVSLSLYSGPAPITYPRVNITISGGEVTAVVPLSVGEGILRSTVFTVDSSLVGNTGSGFTVSVASSALIPTAYLYRESDSNFGKATDVVYQHIFGIPASTLQTYINSLIYNHYWRYITLGELKTAIARNDQNEIIYEVVYSEIIDNLVNDQGISISKEVAWPRSIPGYGGTTVYPNSLPNMRQQVVDYIENQVTDTSILPLWMTSQQLSGGSLGFKPAWVICYTKPGYSEIIKANIETYWEYKLNQLAFELDRIEINRSMTYEYNPSTSTWVALPSAVIYDDSEDEYAYFPQKTIIG